MIKKRHKLSLLFTSLTSLTLYHYITLITNNALCRSCGNSYFEVPNFDKLFLCGPGCPKIFVELRKPPKNLEKAKKEKHEEEKEGGNAKNMKGVFAKVKTGLKKIVLINATIFALCTFLANNP